MTIGLENFKEGLSHHTRTILIDDWQVGANPSKTQVQAVLRNPPGNSVDIDTNVAGDITGATIQFFAGKNIGVYRTIQSATTSGDITLSSALPNTPSTGDKFLIFGTSKSGTNIEEVGGTQQTGADWTTLLQDIKTSVADALTQALPSGSNLIGKVDVSGSLPAGTNTIGDVGVTSLPALPSGSNIIGSIKLSDGTNVFVIDANGSQQIVAFDSSGNEIFTASNPAITKSSGGTVGPTTLLATIPYSDFTKASSTIYKTYKSKLTRNATSRTFEVVNSMDQALTTLTIGPFNSAVTSASDPPLQGYANLTAPGTGGTISIASSDQASQSSFGVLGAKVDSAQIGMGIGSTLPTSGNVEIYVTEFFG